MEKNIKIKQLTERLESYGKIKERLETLIKALLAYDKKTINKTFFVKYFSDKDGRKDWNGNTYTDFHFTDKAYDWQKYAKRIYLAGQEYLEVNEITREGVLKDANEKIEHVNAWILSAQNELKNVQETNEEQLVKDLRAVYIKHNKPTLWNEVLNNYKVKYPEEE